MELPINKILENYTVKAPERAIRKEVAEVISEVVGVSLNIEDVTYQKGNIHIDATPLTRSQIHIHKSTIKEKISERLKKRNIKDLH